MAFDGFLSLGSTELVNSARTVQYASQVVPLLDLADCWDCEDLRHALGDEPYNSPLVDQPDWFSHHDPDSWDFCGLYPLSIEGLDDGVRQATVTELTLDGAVIGAPRYGSREIRVTGLLIGATDAAVTYGLTWLAKALEGAACREGGQCTGDHLCYYSACPPMCTDSPALANWPPFDPDAPTPHTHESAFYLCDDGLISTAERACSVAYERTLYQVTTTSGPTVVERYNMACASMVRVEFTMVAGVPFAFSTAISAVPGPHDIPHPQLVDQVDCVPGTDVVVRTNLATNPVPVGHVGAAGGWRADGTGFTVTEDTEVVRLVGDHSVRLERTEAAPVTNLAPNPDPAGTLDHWSWLDGQGGAQTSTALVTTGGGPNGQGSFQRTTIVTPKVGGEDGPRYVMAASGLGTYTLDMQVRSGYRTDVRLHVAALDASGQVLGQVTGAAVEAVQGQWVHTGPVTFSTPPGTATLQATALIPGDVAIPAGYQVDAGAMRVVAGTKLGATVLGRLTFVGQHDAAVGTISVEGLAQHAASVFLTAAVPATGRIELVYYDAADQPLSSAVGVGDPIAVGAGWQRLQVIATAPEAAVSAVVSVQVDTVAVALGGDRAWVANAQVEQTTAVMSYFDGTTPPVDSMTYEWTGTEHASTSQALLALTAPAIPIIDPDCPTVPDPPRPPGIVWDCVSTPTRWRRYVGHVHSDLVPMWGDAVPIVKLNTGDAPVRQARVRFYANPLEGPLEALNPCDYCGEFVVTYIPPGSQMVIDGIRQWVTVINDQTGNTATGNHLLVASDGGPVTWPLLGCGTSYLMVVDVDEAVDVDDLTHEICLAARG